MTSLQVQPLSAEWKDRLDLSLREVPELYEDPGDVGRNLHAGAIRMALEDLGASAIFCVHDVPTVVIVSLEEYNREQIVELHGALWNQGLATLLLVLSGDTVRAFSLARKPYWEDSNFDQRCLVSELDAVSNSLAVKNFIYGAESGRLWEEHSDYFKPGERIDQVLLGNLEAAHKALCGDGLANDGAQALLIQTMFIAYLEDRGIVGPEYILDATGGVAETFASLLESTSVAALYRLFESLQKDFNGHFFIAPYSFGFSAQRSRVLRAHLITLARFRSGYEEMREGGGQLRLWGYNFKYIPIELVSVVYDRFLATRKEERRRRGAYYTPMLLADTVISALWDVVPEKTKLKGQYLDPACGSGIFLVRLFQRLCEHWRDTHRSRTIQWDSLLGILSRLHGRDIENGAVRVAVFSLYVALLQEVKPPDIRQLMKRGNLLPELWGYTLQTNDFFDASSEGLQADVVIGNPPWTSRRAPDRSSVRWCKQNGFPMPSKEGAWGFVWKSLKHLRKDGMVGFLLPAMGFLHNHAPIAIEARDRLTHHARILRVVNFADLRFQLFEGAVRPAALLIFGRADVDAPGYHFDYWTPKANLNLRMGRVLTLSRADKGTVTSHQVKEDPFVFKRRLWMNDPESKLFRYLSAFPKLSELVCEYGTTYRSADSFADRWVVGNGFQPVNKKRVGKEGYFTARSKLVPNMPYMPINEFQALAQDREHLYPFNDGYAGIVRRKGFERGFDGPRVLVPRGISTGVQRLRATYLEEPMTFEHIILAISVPERDVYGAKLLAALLNSKLFLWFAFHGTASFGSERPEIQQGELLRLPFPGPKDVRQDDWSKRTADELVSLIDEARIRESESFFFKSREIEKLHYLDDLCYRYFGLGEEEVALVEDAVDNVIPAIQPHRGATIDLWKSAARTDREVYVNTLISSLLQWFDEGAAINVTLEARNDDLALLRLRLVDRQMQEPYREGSNRAVGDAFRRLSSEINIPLPGNFQLVPDFRLFAGNNLYLVKPLQRRFWLRSAAIADADALAMELHDAANLGDTG